MVEVSSISTMLMLLQLLGIAGILSGVVQSSLGGYPVISIPGPGVDVDKLPGSSLWSGQENLNLVIEPATVEAKIGGNTLIHFNTPVYRSRGQKSPYLFGPLLRIKGGQAFNVTLYNSLVTTKSTSELQHDVGNTNFHTHGMHGGTGKYNQNPKDQTTNGDNIFITLPGKSKSSDKSKGMTLRHNIPDDHLPGVHWYHPHVHGSTTSQTYSASGLIVVEDNDKFLPDSAGCGPVRKALKDAPDRIFQIQVMTFAKPATRNPWNDANIQLAASEGNSPLCCGDGTLFGTGSEKDLGFINGGWQPTIRMKDGEWQRWRFAMTSFKRYTTLEILDQNNNAPCEIQLVAKDGVYPMQIPRRISYMLIPSGGRVEVLARCKKVANQKLRLVAGHEPLPFTVVGGGGMGGMGRKLKQGGMGGGGMGGGGMGGGGMGSMGVDHLFRQDTLANIQVDSGSPDAAIAQKSCTPRRPDYAADLRDANLAASNAANKIVYDRRATFADSPIGCTIGGEKFSFPDPAPLQAPLGNIVEWSWFMLWNHPLHLHTNPFQIMSLPGGANTLTDFFEVGDYHDTLFLPMIRGASVPVRFQPGPYYGVSVVHCHFLQHEDAGCMKVVEWTCPAGSPGDPKTGKCKNGFNPPVKGTL